MKTFSFLVAALLLAAGSAHAQKLDRIGGFTTGGDPASAAAKAARQQQLALEARRRPNAAQDVAWVPVENVLRRVGGKLVDLRPFWAWKEAGRDAWAAYRPFSLPDPLPEWASIAGTVQFVASDGDVAVTRDDTTVFVRNWPGRASAQTGSAIEVLARKIGTRNASSALGAGRTLALYDYGEPATAEEIATVAKAEAEVRARAQAKAKDAAAEAEAKRKADIAARVEKARAEREAKEKPAAK